MSGFTFGGQTTATATGFSVGMPQQTTAGSGFAFGGTPQAPTAIAQPIAQPAANQSFAFGTPTAAPTLGAVQPTLGAQPASTAPAFGFSSTPTASAAAVVPLSTSTPAGMSFGLSAPPYGAQTAPASIAPLSAATTAAPTFGLGSATTSAPTLGLQFGAPPSTTTQPAALPAFGGFGATSTAQATTVPSFGGFGANTTATVLTPKPAFGAQTTTLGTFGATSLIANKTTIGGFGLTTTTTTSTVSNTHKIGLGGIDVNASQPNKAVEGQTDSSKVKENQLPQEIIATVDSLKDHIKKQKTLSSDIVRASSRKISNVTTELNTLNWSLAEIHSRVEANYVAIKQLRAETSKAIQEAEISQRTHETLSGLQFENTAPLLYFMDLVRKFESDMLTIRKQLELTETHIRSLINPQTYTADDLKKGLQQIHECFIALAGRLQETHRSVETQQEQFCNFMKHRGGRDKTTEYVFDGASGTQSDYGSNQPMIQQIASGSRAIIPPNVACGPTPFSSFGNDSFLHKLNSSSIGISGNFGVVNTSGFGANQSTSNLFGGVDDSLNKPTLGSKRNKH